MMSCKEATQLISRSLDTNLPGWKRFGLKIHLLMCRFCSRFENQLSFIGDTIKFYRKNIEIMDDTSVTMSQETRERLKNALRERSDEI
jgi:hypothetical protein